eukprot:SAG11_NODE_42080_length_185_cov_25.081395_1_plen_61_part_11
MKVVKLLKNDYVLAKVSPKKEIKLQTSKLMFSKDTAERIPFRDMKEKYGLKENDIFITPDV